MSNLGGPGHNTAENGARPTADAARAVVRVVNGRGMMRPGGFCMRAGGILGRGDLSAEIQQSKRVLKLCM